MTGDPASARPRCTAKQAVHVSKHGIDLTIYVPSGPSGNVAKVFVQRGHFQEFYNIRSTYLYYVVSGSGTFYVDDEPYAVGPSDLVTVLPGSRVYYFGTMELVLTVAPTFDERDERHVRFLSETDSPYQ